MTDALRDEICRGGASATLRRLAREAGMGTLASDARRAVLSGLTTPHEAAPLLRAADPTGPPCRSCGRTAPVDALACPECGRRRGLRCRCGRGLEAGWRYCPWCVRALVA